MHVNACSIKFIASSFNAQITEYKQENASTLYHWTAVSCSLKDR